MPVGPRYLDPRELRATRRLGWTDAWSDRDEADPTGAGVELLLHVRIGGLDLRAGTREVVMQTSTGQTVAYAPNLLEDFELSEVYEPGSGSAPGRSVTIQLPNAVVSAASLIASGSLLAGEGEVAMGFDRMPYEERHVLLDGDLVGGVSFGDAGEPVEFELADPTETAGYLVTPYVVDANLWPAAATQAVGQRYPLVYNRWDRVPTLLVASQKCLVCVSQAGITAGNVSVYVDGDLKATGDAQYGHAVNTGIDGEGTTYIAIDFSGTETIDDEDVAATVVGGSTALQYLHDLCEYLAIAYTSLGRRRVHYGLLGDVRARLGSIPVKLLVNGSGEATSADAFSLLADRVANSFPMLCFGYVDGRYGPIVTDGRAPHRADLVEGRQLLRRASAVQESDKRDLFNDFTVRHSYDSVEDDYAGVATRNPDTSVLCSRSQKIVGDRFAGPIDADLIYRQQDAEAVVDWLAWHRSMPSYLVEYDVPVLVALRLRLGWNVRLFVPSLGFSGIVSTIVSRTFRRGACTLGFRVWWANIAGVGSGGGASTATSGGGGQ